MSYHGNVIAYRIWNPYAFVPTVGSYQFTDKFIHLNFSTNNKAVNIIFRLGLFPI